jgi:hypothetical protein
MTTAVDAVFLGKERRFNRRFLRMCSHYLSSRWRARRRRAGRRVRSRTRSATRASTCLRRGCILPITPSSTPGWGGALPRPGARGRAS